MRLHSTRLAWTWTSTRPHLDDRVVVGVLHGVHRVVEVLLRGRLLHDIVQHLGGGGARAAGMHRLSGSVQRTLRSDVMPGRQASLKHARLQIPTWVTRAVTAVSMAQSDARGSTGVRVEATPTQQSQRLFSHII